MFLFCSFYAIPMNWQQQIEIQSQNLIDIIATLFAMLAGGAVSQVKSEAKRIDVLRILRPAEAAVRRLIVLAERQLVETSHAPRPMPPGVVQRLRASRGTYDSRPLFQLSDPVVPMVETVHEHQAVSKLRISTIAPMDPTVTAIFARHSALKPTAHTRAAETTPALVRRLEAIQLALENLPRQAKRLRRWKARREKLSATRLVYTQPLRPGPAPYLPKTPFRDIDYVLERCHLLARDCLRADTS
jgi:hypothetical protein